MQYLLDEHRTQCPTLEYTIHHMYIALLIWPFLVHVWAAEVVFTAVLSTHRALCSSTDDPDEYLRPPLVPLNYVAMQYILNDIVCRFSVKGAY